MLLQKNFFITHTQKNMSGQKHKIIENLNSCVKRYKQDGDIKDYNLLFLTNFILIFNFI